MDVLQMSGYLRAQSCIDSYICWWRREKWARNLPGCFLNQRNEVGGSAALRGWLCGPPLFGCLASGFIADRLWKLGKGNQSGPQPACVGRLDEASDFSTVIGNEPAGKVI